MRLFGALWRKRMPNGHIWRGKDRLSKPVTLQDVGKLRNQLEIEERNMFLLRHPYMNLEQSHGHAQALGKPQARLEALMKRPKTYKENITLEKMLGHLRHKEAWD